MKNRVRELRQKQGITAIEMSEKAAITVSALYMIEREERTPSLETARRISDIFGHSVETVFYD